MPWVNEIADFSESEDSCSDSLDFSAWRMTLDWSALGMKVGSEMNCDVIETLIESGAMISTENVNENETWTENTSENVTATWI